MNKSKIKLNTIPRLKGQNIINLKISLHLQVLLLKRIIQVLMITNRIQVY